MERLIFYLCELYMDWKLSTPLKRRKFYTKMVDSGPVYLCNKFNNVSYKSLLFRSIRSLYGPNSIYYNKFRLPYFLKYLPELYTSIILCPLLREEIVKSLNKDVGNINFESFAKTEPESESNYCKYVGWFDESSEKIGDDRKLRDEILSKAISLTYTQKRYH